MAKKTLRGISLGWTSLILAVIAVALAILPLIYTQLFGVTLGLFALLLGLWAKKCSTQKRIAVAGIWLGSTAALVSVLIYGTLMYTGQQAGEQLVKRVTQGEMAKIRNTVP